MVLTDAYIQGKAEKGKEENGEEEENRKEKTILVYLYIDKKILRLSFFLRTISVEETYTYIFYISILSHFRRKKSCVTKTLQLLLLTMDQVRDTKSSHTIIDMNYRLC